MQRLLASIVLIMLAGTPGCGEVSTVSEGDVRQLAQRFYDAAVSRDTRRMLDLVTYPFRFDDVTVENEERFRDMLEKKWAQVAQRVQSAGYINMISYEDFLAGKEFMGVSLEKQQAIEQARRINFHERCILVRFYYADKETRKEDGRGYFLVIKETPSGLRIVTYYD